MSDYDTAGLALGAVPSEPEEQRKWAHAQLECLLDFRTAWLRNEPPLRSPWIADEAKYREQDAAARKFFDGVLTFASVLIGHPVKEAVTPTYTGNDPVQMRSALADLLNLLRPVVPHRPKLVGSGFSRDSHWIDDLLRSLEMLNEGATPDLFRPNTQAVSGRRARDWWRTRYKALMALWAIQLGHRGVPKPAVEVAAAFRCNGRNGRYHETISRNARRMENAAAEGSGLLGLSAEQIRCAVQIAREELAPGQAEQESLAKRLSNIVFGTRQDGPASMEEAGLRYQEFERASVGQ